MWHVAEGDLHAYLDGALELYPPRDARRIRDHLERCADCGRRLERAGFLTGRARDVLAAASPPDMSAPPLEELRRRARSVSSRERRSGVAGRLRWAWAATVVLALGIGWGVGAWPFGASPEEGGPALRGSTTNPAASAGATSDVDVAVSQDESPPEAATSSGAEPVPEASIRASGESSAQDPAPPAAVGSRDPLAGVDALASLDRRRTPELVLLPALEGAGRLAERLEAPPALTASAEAVAPREALLGPDVSGAARRRDPGRSAPPADADGASLSVSGRSVVAQVRVVPGIAGDLRPPGVRVEAGEIRRDPPAPRSADASPPAPLILPGLDVRSVEWTEVAPGDGGILVLQHLEDGTPVELRFVGLWLEESGNRTGRRVDDTAVSAPARFPVPSAAAPPEHLATLPLPPGWEQVAHPFRGGWVLIRGPLSERRLRALLESAGVTDPSR
jgi:hypothetical protein